MQIEPSIIVDIEFQRPKRGRDIGTPSATDRQSLPKKRNIPPPPSNAREVFLSGLKKVMPKAVIFSSVAPLALSNMTHSIPVRKLPVLLSLLQNPKYTNMSTDELESACNDVFANLKVTKDEADYL